MNKRVVSILSLIGLLSAGTFLLFAESPPSKKPNASNEEGKGQELAVNGRNLLEVPFPDIIPDKYFTRSLVTIARDIFYVYSGDIVSKDTIEAKFRPEFGQWKLKYFLTADDGTDAMVVKSTGWGGSEKTAIVFRGSQEIKDWVTNFHFFLEQSKFPHAPPGVEVHGGFQESLVIEQEMTVVTETENAKTIVGRVGSILEQEALRAMGDSDELIVTGISLG